MPNQHLLIKVSLHFHEASYFFLFVGRFSAEYLKIEISFCILNHVVYKYSEILCSFNYTFYFKQVIMDSFIHVTHMY